MIKKSVYRTTLVFTMFLTAFTACVSSQFPFPVKGSGELKDKNYTISDFKGISVSGGFDVILIQGSTEGVVLSAQENLFEYLTVRVEEGILKIYTEKNIMATKGLRARISLKSISSLKVSGGGDITSETSLDVPKLAIELSGGGDLTTNLKADEMNCRISGGGNASIDGSVRNYNLGISGGGDVKSEISANIVDCSISGGGNLSLKSRDKISNANFVISGGGDLNIDIEADLLKCSISGGGDAVLNGRAGMLDISVGGGGDVNAGRLAAQTAKFNASGGSDVHIYASNELSGYISGGGNLYYSGNPALKNIEAKGGSEVRKE